MNGKGENKNQWTTKELLLCISLMPVTRYEPTDMYILGVHIKRVAYYLNITVQCYSNAQKVAHCMIVHACVCLHMFLCECVFHLCLCLCVCV